MEDRLKECPFCENGWVEKEFGVFILWHKPTCIFGGPNGVVHSTRLDESFVTKWNTRITDPLLEKMAEALAYWLPYIKAEVGASHLMDGFKPRRNRHDDELGLLEQALQEYRESKNDSI